MIPERELERGCWYHGEGRFVGNLGLWDGSLFHGLQCKFGHYVSTAAIYGDQGFSPMQKIELKEAP